MMLIDVVDRLGDPVGELGCRDPTLQPLQAETDAEQLLDDGVVEVASDAIVVLGQRPTPVGVGELFLGLDA